MPQGIDDNDDEDPRWMGPSHPRDINPHLAVHNDNQLSWHRYTPTITHHPIHLPIIITRSHDSTEGRIFML